MKPVQTLTNWQLRGLDAYLAVKWLLVGRTEDAESLERIGNEANRRGMRDPSAHVLSGDDVPEPHGARLDFANAILRSVFAVKRGRPTGFIVDLLTPPAYAEEALFNIMGRYDHWLTFHRRRKANFIFHVQCIGAVLSYWMERLHRVLGSFRSLFPS